MHGETKEVYTKNRKKFLAQHEVGDEIWKILKHEDVDGKKIQLEILTAGKGKY